MDKLLSTIEWLFCATGAERERAAKSLQAQLRVLVRRVLPSHTPLSIEDEVTNLIEKILKNPEVFRGERMDCPRTYLKKVIRNHLDSAGNKLDSQRRRDQAYAEQWSASLYSEHCRRYGVQRQTGGRVFVEDRHSMAVKCDGRTRSTTATRDYVDEKLLNLQRLALVEQRLVQDQNMTGRRKVLTCVSLGLPPEPHLESLASELDESVTDTRARVDHWRTHGTREALIRITHPHGCIGIARQAHARMFRYVRTYLGEQLQTNPN